MFSTVNHFLGPPIDPTNDGNDICYAHQCLIHYAAVLGYSVLTSILNVQVSRQMKENSN